MTRTIFPVGVVSPVGMISTRVRHFAARQALALCIILSFLLVLGVTNSNVPLLLKQGLAWYITSKTAHSTGLVSTSRVVHYVEDNGLNQLTAEPQDGFPGWVAYTPRPNAYITRVRLTVSKDTGCVTIYPRIFGADTRIDVFELMDDLKIPMFTLIGERKSWTPIGLRATVSLGYTLECESSGKKNFEIVMYGNKVQLWAKDNSLIF